MEGCFEDCFTPMFLSDFHKTNTPAQLVIMQPAERR